MRGHRFRLTSAIARVMVQTLRDDKRGWEGRGAMLRRRDLLRFGLTAGGAGALAGAAGAAVKAGNPKDYLQFLCPPDGEPPDLAKASPKARPFVQELYVPPIKQPV